MASVYKSISKTSGRREASDTEEPKNLQRVLILSSRGVTFRHRHLLNDLHSLLPHSRKESKLDTKTKLYQLNELADLYNCNNILFFEARKGKDLYMWMSRAPNGPTVKMHLQNLHTMSELHFPGNCLKGSRPILSFDANFDTQPHFMLIKELLTLIFSVPKSSRKVKPFVDHVMGFSIADGKIWSRCFQINETDISKTKSGTAPPANAGVVVVTEEGGQARQAQQQQKRQPERQATDVEEVEEEDGETKISLTEIGPRFVLTPIVILESSFGGPVIYENKEFVSPNQVRSDLRRGKAGKYARRAEEGIERTAKKRDLGLRTGEGKRKRAGEELENSVLFA